MKKFIKRLFIIGIVVAVLLVGAFYGVNYYVMPSVVNAKELVLPNVVGMEKKEAVKKLKALNLTPIEVGPRYDARYKKDEVIFQKPYAGTKVKEHRRVYIHISGGEPLIKMPQITGKTMRDAKINLERLGLFIGKVEEVRSELPGGTIVEQEFAPGEELAKGDSVALKISVGPQVGMVRVPSLIARSTNGAEKILRRLGLKLGKKSYVESPTLLPNTVISQTPSENSLIEIGGSVNVVISKSKR
jgi:serine/threonine-protein kinase